MSFLSFKSRSVFALFLFATAMNGQQKVAHSCADSSKTIGSALKTDYLSLLKFLYEVGVKTEVCIGFEGSDHFVFDKPVHLVQTSGTARDIVRGLLKQFPKYCMGEEHRVLTVTLCEQAKNTWLDYRITSVKWQPNFLQAISNGLFGTLQYQITPTNSSFGHFRSGVVSDVIGPYDLQGQTVRALLNRFVGDSQGAMWFTDKPFTRHIRAAQKENPELFWRIIEYQDFPDQNAGNLEIARSAAAAAFLVH